MQINTNPFHFDLVNDVKKKVNRVVDWKNKNHSKYLAESIKWNGFFGRKYGEKNMERNRNEKIKGKIRKFVEKNGKNRNNENESNFSIFDDSVEIVHILAPIN